MVHLPRKPMRGAWLAGIAAWFAISLVLALRSGGTPRSAPLPDEPETAVQHHISPDPSKGENMNVLLVTIDTLRPDRLGCYGYSAARTPVLDSLAAGGLLFEHAYSQAPLTLPSHATIMTGRSPARHGIHVNGSNSLSPADETLAEVLRGCGYRTAAFVSAIVLHRRYGLDQGFDFYDDEVNRREKPTEVLVSDRPANEVTDAALRWFNQPAGQANFFAWVHYYDPHADYTPPPPYDRLLAGRPYDGEIAFTDHELGRLLDGLRARGRLENTLVVVASDHGESLGEHGEETHAILVYDSTLRVAFMVSHPDARREDAPASSPWRRRRLPQLARLLDIAPTILDLVGAPIPPGTEGESLLPLITGSGPGPELAYAESHQTFVDYGWARLLSMRDGRWKYIHSSRDELFDTSRDPKEETNLAAEEPEVTRRLKKELQRYLNDAAKDATPAQSVTVDPGTLQRLQAIGYLGGAAPSAEQGPVDISEDEKRLNPEEHIEEHNDLIFAAVEDLEEEHPAAARKKLLRMLEIDPTNKSALSFLANCEYQLGNLKGARECLERVIKIAPEWNQPLQVLSTVLHDMGEKDLAIDALRQAISLNPVNPEAREVLATYLRERGDLEEAVSEYETAVEEDPGFTRAFFDLGLAYEEMDRPDKASDSFRKVIDQDPDHLGAIEHLATIYARNGPCSWSIPLYQKAIRLAEDSRKAALYANLGNAQATLKEHEKAKAAYQESLRRDPKNAQTHYALGVSLAFLGDVPGARRQWQEALEINPHHEAARANLEKVRAAPAGAPPGA